MKEPVARSDLRLALGGAYYGTLRKLLWIKERRSFTRERCEEPQNAPDAQAAGRGYVDAGE